MTGDAERIVVAGDAHLGAANADVDAFDSFLDDLHRDRAAITQFVLLGDVLDLVRRDPFGCALEVSETLTRLKRLAAAVPTYLVFGNHDACLRNVDDARYDIRFREFHVAESGGHTLRFCHGNAFDRLQFDALSARLSGPGDRGDIDPTRGLKDPVVEGGRRLLQRGKRRLRSLTDGARETDATTFASYPRRERRAHAYLNAIPEDKLVYGHTHSPYVRADNAAANPGSWKTTASLHNTYLVVERGDITLYRHRESGDPERIAAAATT